MTTQALDWRTVPPGVDFDRAVAARVFGETWGDDLTLRDAGDAWHCVAYRAPESAARINAMLPKYSRDMRAASRAFGALVQRGRVHRLTIDTDGGRDGRPIVYSATLDGAEGSWSSYNWCATPAEAVSRAVLAAVDA